MIAAGKSLFAGDPADDVIDLAKKTRADALLVPFQTPRGRRRLGLAAVSLVGLYFAMTVGAHGVAALGVGVAKAPKNVDNTMYVGVRIDGRELRHHDVTDAIRSLGVTVVVDGRTAGHAGRRLSALADAGVDIANGGWGKGRTLRWNRAHDDCDKSWQVITRTSGEKAREFVPGRSLDAFDQIYCRTGEGKQKLVRPNVTFRPEDVPDPESRRIYLLDGRDRDPVAVAIALEDLHARATADGLRDPTARGPALSAAVAVGAAAAGAAGALAVVHAGPALAGVSPLGMRFTPALVGRGRPDHVALTFDDGPDPGFDARLPRRARSPRLARDLLHARHDGARARRRSSPRSRRPATRSRCTATSTATCSGGSRARLPTTCGAAATRSPS